MSCVLTFPEPSVRIDLCSKGNKQKILIDLLTKYCEMDMTKLASILDVSVQELNDICEADSFLIGEQAESLTQLFLMFLGEHFFSESTLTRSFVKG